MLPRNTRPARNHEKLVGVVGAVSLSSGPRLMAMEAEMPVQGLTTVKSRRGPQETMNRLEAAVKAKGMTVFVRIDHAAGAASVGMSLDPTEVLIFGNARGGTPLMQSGQTIGIDLPLKALVWQDGSGDTWLSYNDPAWIAARHKLSGNEAAIANLAAALDSVTSAAAAE